MEQLQQFGMDIFSKASEWIQSIQLWGQTDFGPKTGAEWVIFVVLNLFLLICLWTDWKYHKVFNKYTYPTIFLGFFLNSLFYGMDGLKTCCLSFALSLLFFLIFYAFHWIGAGDVKMIIAVSVLNNVFYAFGALILSSFLAAFYGMFLVIRGKRKEFRVPFGVFVSLGFFLYQILIFVLL